jgi:hypothetical protein
MSNSIREKLPLGQTNALQNGRGSAVGPRPVEAEQNRSASRLSQLARDLDIAPRSTEAPHQHDTPRSLEMLLQTFSQMVARIQRLLGGTQKIESRALAASNQPPAGSLTREVAMQARSRPNSQVTPSFPSDLTPIEKTGQCKWTPMPQFDEVHFSVPKREGLELDGIYIMAPDGQTFITEVRLVRESLLREGYDARLKNIQISSLPPGCVIVVEYKRDMKDAIRGVPRQRDYVRIPDPQKMFKY